MNKSMQILANSDDLYSAHDFDIDIAIPGVPMRSGTGIL